MRKFNKSPNFYLAVLVAAIFVSALLLVSFSNNSGVKLKEGSPARTVQNYLQSIIDGRNDLAFTYLSKDSICTVEDIDRSYLYDQVQLTLQKETIVGISEAVVQISIQQGESMMMGNVNEEKQSFRLIKENGLWKISGIPWPLYDCGVRTK
jgi:hypothetical protein